MRHVLSGCHPRSAVISVNVSGRPPGTPFFLFAFPSNGSPLTNCTSGDTENFWRFALFGPCSYHRCELMPEEFTFHEPAAERPPWALSPSPGAPAVPLRNKRFFVLSGEGFFVEVLFCPWCGDKLPPSRYSRRIQQKPKWRIRDWWKRL